MNTIKKITIEDIDRVLHKLIEEQPVRRNMVCRYIVEDSQGNKQAHCIAACVMQELGIDPKVFDENGNNDTGLINLSYTGPLFDRYRHIIERFEHWAFLYLANLQQAADRMIGHRNYGVIDGILAGYEYPTWQRVWDEQRGLLKQASTIS